MISEISIRPCAAADAAALALVGSATFLETFAGVLNGSAIVEHCERAHSVEVYKTWLANTVFKLWLVEMDPGRAPIGYMVVGLSDLPLHDLSAHDLELKRIYVLSKFHGGGIGKKLVAAAARHGKQRNANRLLLGVYANNVTSIAFYERMGFLHLGARRFNVGGTDYDDKIMGMPIARST